ncbi:Gfo/Idh/MocA family protein [Streptomyces sp. NPDC051217]|uniref:Gfo/Idh/MocA family protein n=1 Tax=Streptomyces sp. NPDC051217 TaxID=3365644 RepID=UPI0037A643E9
MVAPASPLRVGVLGCADIARRRILPAMAACDGVEIAAVASRDADRAARTAREFGCPAVDGYAELLALDEVDAVYAPLPAALHARWVEAALRADKHVLAEKPLTTERARTADLLALADARGLALMENVMFVHHPQHTAVRELLADGAIGALHGFQSAFTVPRRPAGDVRHDPDLGGGALWDTGVYPLRAALHLLGPELELVAALRSSGPEDRVDTGGAALLSTPAGVFAQLSYGLDHAYRSSYELVGSEGRITLDRAFTPPADHPPVIRVERASGTEEIVLEPHDQVAATLNAFASAARAGRAPRDAVADCLRQAALLESALLKGGRPLTP